MIIQRSFSSVLHRNVSRGYSLESPRSTHDICCYGGISKKQNYPTIILKYPPDEVVGLKGFI